jgi:biotin transport system substrate-specific component
MTMQPVLGSRPDALRASGLALGARRLQAIGVFGFAAALAAASQISVPIPGTPVPATLQPMVVVLAGLMLGPKLGPMSMMVFLAAGAIGLPVFTPGGAPGILRFVGPTGGYLIAYPFAAFVAGYVRARRPTLLWRWIAAMLAMVVIFIGGLTQLSLYLGGVGPAVAAGITPFALLDIVKALIAALIARPSVRTRLSS